MERALLERTADLAVLRDAVAAAGEEHGSVVLVSGEAGIGKTALVETFLSHVPNDVRVLRGACDDLSTPRPLGPLRDIARVAGGDLAALLQQGDREPIYAAVLDLLDHPLHATVMVVEDAHWGDDATLDLLRYVARRIEPCRGILVVTHREEGLTVRHPLRRVLGGLSGVPVHRVSLRRLTQRAIAQLIGSRPLDAAAVADVTGGNPFYVTELLDAEGMTVPATVVDAVMARLGNLSPAGRAATEQLAVIPSAVEIALARQLVDPAGLAEAEEHGVVEVVPEAIRLRHELTRRAIVAALPQSRRLALNAHFLEVLLASDRPDPARVVHHALAAGDIDRLLEYGPKAAAEAAATGAHSQAVAHYATLLPHLGSFEPSVQADLLEAHALESYYLGDSTAAVRSQQRASELRRRLGDPVALGANLVWLARHHWWSRNRGEAEVATAEAIRVLEGVGEDLPELALAYSRQAQLLMLSYDDQAALPWAERAAELARRVGDRRVLAHALCNLGASRWHLGDPAGQVVLEESLAIAREIGAHEDACRAYTNTVWQLLRLHRHQEARELCAEALAFADEHEQIGFGLYLHGTLAMSLLDTGDIEGAIAEARVVDVSSMEYVGALPAMITLANAMVRRGDPGAEAALERAWSAAEPSAELQRLVPAVAARAEHAWLTGADGGVLPVLREVQALADRHDNRLLTHQLGYWRWKLGDQVAAVGAGGRASPEGRDAWAMSEGEDGWTLQVAGQWEAAARWWGDRQRPYERALALAESDEEAPMLEAVVVLERLGAEPAARMVRARLRELGVRGVPRGPVAATRANPAGLTPRQLDVLELISQGLTNAQIAERLVVSPRTVDHHVSAILQKLDVPTRQEATDKAREFLRGHGAQDEAPA